MLKWKVCKIIPVWDVNYAARKMGDMCNGRIRSLRLKQILVNHKICKESVANPGFAKMNINVMSIWWHDNFCPFTVVNFYVQTIHSSTETRVLWAKYRSEANTTFTSEGFLLFLTLFSTDALNWRSWTSSYFSILIFRCRLQHGQASPAVQVCKLRPRFRLSQEVKRAVQDQCTVSFLIFSCNRTLALLLSFDNGCKNFSFAIKTGSFI